MKTESDIYFSNAQRANKIFLFGLLINIDQRVYCISCTLGFGLRKIGQTVYFLLVFQQVHSL